MHSPSHPHAVRMIGFCATDADALCAALTQSPAAGPHFYCLLEDSLQEPDLYLLRADDPDALTMLAALNPNDLTPVLLLGPATPALPYPSLALPVEPQRLHQKLAELVARRAQAMARLAASGHPAVMIERRRNPRIDVDLADHLGMQFRDTQPGNTQLADAGNAQRGDGGDSALHPQAHRRQPPPAGAILIVDKGGAFRDHVAKMIGPRRMPIEWTDSAGAAVRLCDETPVSLLMINTSTPQVDPYRLCADVKGLPTAARTAVVFLVARSYPYDAPRARAAGVRGLLDKPVADRHLYSAIKKLMSLA